MNLLSALTLIVGGLVLIVFVSFLLSWPVMMLWNGCLVGAVAGISHIDWTTAWGISLLCGLLFKPSTSSSK